MSPQCFVAPRIAVAAVEVAAFDQEELDALRRPPAVPLDQPLFRRRVKRGNLRLEVPLSPEDPVLAHQAACILFAVEPSDLAHSLA